LQERYNEGTIQWYFVMLFSKVGQHTSSRTRSQPRKRSPPQTQNALTQIG
jgi:hypothetical protein